MQLLHPTPTSHHAKRRTLISKDLDSCTHIFIRKDAICKSLQPPYDGPFEVIKCTPKFFTVTVNGNPQNISLDRLKPAHLEPPSRTPTTGTTTSMPPVFTSMAASSAPHIRTMRSGRHVHFPDKFASWFVYHQLTGGGVLWRMTFLRTWAMTICIWYVLLFICTNLRMRSFLGGPHVPEL